MAWASGVGGPLAAGVVATRLARAKRTPGGSGTTAPKTKGGTSWPASAIRTKELV